MDDPQGRVACETCTTTGLVLVMGEISTSTYVDIPTIVRHTIRDAGYQDSSFGFDFQSCGIAVSVTSSHPIYPTVCHTRSRRGMNFLTATMTPRPLEQATRG